MHGRVAARLLGEVPVLDVFLLEHGRARGAVQLDALEVAGERGGGGFDDAEGAVVESQRRDGDVFDFDPLVGERGGVGLHFDHGAHEPGEQVDGVDGLVHEGAAAVEGPGAAPGAAVVVLLRAVPLHVGVAEREPAEAAGVDGLLHELRRVVEPRRERWRRV